MKQKNIFKRVLSLLLAVAMVAGTLQVMGPNTPAVVEAADTTLITNGDFETANQTNWTYTGADDSTDTVPAQEEETVMVPNVILTEGCNDSASSRWQLFSSTGEKAFTTDPSDSANQVIKFTSEVTNDGIRYRYDGLFEYGETYTISFDYYGAARINLVTLGLKSNENTTVKVLPSSDGKWTTYTFEIEMTDTDSATAQYIAFRNSSSAGSVFYIDNLTVACGKVEKVSEITRELVTNGNFENTSYDYTKDWRVQGSTGSMSVVTDSSNRVLQFTSTDSTSGVDYNAGLVKGFLEKDKTYTISFKYKGAARFHIYTLGLLSASHQIYDDWLPSSANGWTTYSFDITPSYDTTTTSMQIYFKMATAEGGTFYLDDLSITTTETLTETTYTQGIGTCIESGVPAEEDNVLYVEDYKSVSTPVEIKAGNRYKYSFQIKNSATGNNFDFDVHAGGTKVADVKSGALSASAEWETISGVFKATEDATSFGFLRSGVGSVYLDDASLVEIPGDHTPSLEEGYIPNEAEVIINDDIGTTRNGVVCSGTEETDYVYEDGMVVLNMNASNTYLQTRSYELTKGHTYVFKFYIWIQNADNIQMEVAQLLDGVAGPTGGTRENYLMAYARNYDTYTITVDGEKATSSFLDNTNGWKEVVLTWTAQGTGVMAFLVRGFPGKGTGTVYIDDITLYDNSKAATQEKLLTNYYDLGSGTEGYLVTKGDGETVTITDASGAITNVEEAYTTINKAGEYTITRNDGTTTVTKEIVLYNRGDANADYDGKITAKDLIATKKLQQDIVINSASSKAADINADGVLSSEDDAFLRRAIVNDYDIVETKKGVSGLGQGVMPIIGYDGPTNAEEYDKLSALGMNYLVVNSADVSSDDTLAQEILECAEKNNIKVFLNNDNAVNPDGGSAIKEAEDLASYNSVYDSYNSFAGYYVADGAYYKKQYTSENGTYKANNGIAEYAGVLGAIAKYANVSSYFNLLPMNSAALEYSFSGSEDTVAVTYENYVAYVLASSIAGSDFLSNEVPLVDGAENFYKNLAWMRAISQDETIAKPFYATVKVDEDNQANMYLETNAALAFGAKGIQYDKVSETLYGAYTINTFIKATDFVLMDAESKGVMTTDNTIKGYIERGTVENYGVLGNVSGDQALVGCFDYYGHDTYLVVNTDTAASTSVTLTFDKEVNGVVTSFGGTSSNLRAAATYTVTLGAGESVLVVLDTNNSQEISGGDTEGVAISTNMQDTIVHANAIANAVQGYYTDGDKTSYVIENQNMKLTHGLAKGGKTVMSSITNAEGGTYLTNKGNTFDAVITVNGTTSYSNASSIDVWANTTQMGYYYYETRLQQMNFGSNIANMYLEKTYHTYADKLYQEFRVIATNDTTESQVSELGFRAYIPKESIGEGGIVYSKDGSTVYTDISSGNNTELQYVGFDIKDVGIIGFIVAGQNGVDLRVTQVADAYYVTQYVTSPSAFTDFTEDETANWTNNNMTVPTGYITFGNRVYTDATHSFDGLKQANYEEQNPLTSANITVDETVSGAEFVGYDYLTGAYKFNIEGSYYTAAHDNPADSNYFEHITIQNVPDDRVIYLDVHAVSGGGTEGAALVDSSGAQIPVPMQVSKNFAKENVTEIYNNDTLYGETYMPLCVKADEEYDFTVINAYWNWGTTFPMKQLSSIEYYTSYYHMSTGTVETTCIAPYYAANDNNGFYDGISYFLPDFRGMSNGELSGDVVQNNSVGVVYGPSNGTALGTYTSSDIHSTGLTYSDMNYSYVSDDGAFEYTMRHVEMPQEDESRTYYTIDFKILKDTTLTQEDFEIIGFDGKHGIYYQAAYLDANGQQQVLQVVDDEKDWSWSELGWTTKPAFQTNTHGYYALHDDGAYFAFYDMALFSSDNTQTGNFGLIVKDSDVSLAFANGTHTPNYWHKSEINYGYLTLAKDTAFKAGDTFSVDLILLPFGEVGTADCNSVVEVYNDSVTNAIKVEAAEGTVVADTWVPTVKAVDNTAEFTLTGGVNANASGDKVNYAVKVTGFDSLMMPLIQRYENGKWVTYDYATILGYDGYSVAYEEDGTYSYSFVFEQTADGNTFRVMPSKNIEVNYFVDGEKVKTIPTKTGATVTAADAKTLGVFGSKIEGYYTDPAFVKAFDFEQPLSDDANICVKLSDYIYIDADMVSMMSQDNIKSSQAITDDTYGEAYQVSGNGGVNMVLRMSDLSLKVGEEQTLKVKIKTENVANLSLRLGGTYLKADGSTAIATIPEGAAGAVHYKDTGYLKAPTNGQFVELEFNLNSNTMNNVEVAKFIEITDIAICSHPSSGATSQSMSIVSIEQAIPENHTVTYKLGDTTLATQTVAHDKQIGEIPSTDIETNSAMIGYQVVGYYMDADCTVEYDFGNWITKDTVVYVKKGTTFYISPLALTKFDQHAVSSSSILSNGAFSVSGTAIADTYVSLYFTGVNISNTQRIEVKAKLHGKGTAEDTIQAFLKGTKQDDTEFGYGNYNMTLKALDGSTDSEGYTTYYFDISSHANIQSIKTLSGFRIDIAGTTTQADIMYVRAVATTAE